MATKWTREEIEQAANLVKEFTAAKAAEEMTRITGRPISRSGLIGALYRAGYGGDIYSAARTFTRIRAPRDIKKPLAGGVKRDKKTKTMQWLQKAIKAPRQRYAPQEPVYKRKDTCKFIGSDYCVCGKDSQGSWCEDHKKIVFVQPWK